MELLGLYDSKVEPKFLQAPVGVLKFIFCSEEEIDIPVQEYYRSKGVFIREEKSNG